MVLSGTVPLAGSTVHAIYLDPDENISVRARIYTQASIRRQNSAIDTEPTTKTGQLIQHRNFFNPELDGNLTPYLRWMKGSLLSWLAPDDLRFRAAGWGFYDGIYDYGSSQFNTAQRKINDSFNPAVPPGPRTGGWFIESPSINTNATTFPEMFSGFATKKPRPTYADQARINELYLSYTKGPAFFRIGRQSISWGESDTIALLDQSNPFSVLLAAPGVFQDVDEARIPLWTVRASYSLFNVLGPFSSGFVESYWVPGDIDVDTPVAPLLTASPYSPRGQDPQFANPVFPPSWQFVFVDNVPQKLFENNRWGFRFQTVISRRYTVQAWVYRTFPQNPVPVKVGRTDNRPININGTNFFVVALAHRLVTVYGLAATFFLQPLDGIIRINAQLFENEAGFIPEENLNICTGGCPSGRNPLLSPGAIPRLDMLRYEVGFDRFFFIRSLNPSNSFVLSSSIVGSWNLSETSRKDFRFNGILKPPGVVDGMVQPRGAKPTDYVQLKTADAQGQITLQTDYFHGRLSPRLTLIGYTRGTWAIHPTITYRWSDWLLFSLDYVTIGGAYQALGFFRDRDQISFRVTYQLN